MGRVFEALDLKHDRSAAVKVIYRRLAHDPEFRTRFAREAEAAAAKPPARAARLVLRRGRRAPLPRHAAVRHGPRRPHRGPRAARGHASAVGHQPGGLGPGLGARPRHRPPRRQAGEDPARRGAGRAARLPRDFGLAKVASERDADAPRDGGGAVAGVRRPRAVACRPGRRRRRRVRAGRDAPRLPDGSSPVLAAAGHAGAAGRPPRGRATARRGAGEPGRRARPGRGPPRSGQGPRRPLRELWRAHRRGPLRPRRTPGGDRRHRRRRAGRRGRHRSRAPVQRAPGRERPPLTRARADAPAVATADDGAPPSGGGTGVAAPASAPEGGGHAAVRRRRTGSLLAALGALVALGVVAALLLGGDEQKAGGIRVLPPSRRAPAPRTPSPSEAPSGWPTATTGP